MKCLQILCCEFVVSHGISEEGLTEYSIKILDDLEYYCKSYFYETLIKYNRLPFHFYYKNYKFDDSKLLKAAIKYNNLEVLKCIKINKFNIIRYHPEYVAIKHGNIDIFIYLFKKFKLLPNFQIIHKIIFYNRLNFLKYLIREHNYVPVAMDLTIACEDGNLGIVKFLFKYLDPTIYENNFIATAAINGKLTVVRYLCNHGLDPTQNDNWATALAAQAGHLDIVSFLIERLGCAPDGHNNHGLIWASFYGHYELIEYLISKGADPTAQNHEAITWAIMNNHISIVKYLYSQGCDPTKNNESLLWAIKTKNKDLVRFICEIGCSPSYDNLIYSIGFDKSVYHTLLEFYKK